MLGGGLEDSPPTEYLFYFVPLYARCMHLLMSGVITSFHYRTSKNSFMASDLGSKSFRVTLSVFAMSMHS